MNFDLLTATTLLALFGAALIGGIFYAFSSFAMRSLGKLEPGEGMRAMQSINVEVITPTFLGPFLLTAIFSVILGVTAALNWHEPGAGSLMAGSLAYLAGTFGVTLIGNIPLNNALEAADSKTPAGLDVWAHYLKRWTLLNSVRTFWAIVAACLFLRVLVERL